MAIQVSPGVSVSEIDLTTIIPAVSTSAGAIGGLFRWGPIGQIVLVDSEKTLVSRYGKPTNYNAETFFTAANFLAYGNQLYVSRAANTADTSANGTWTAVADSANAVAPAVASGFATTANTTSGSNTITLASTTNLYVGQPFTSTAFTGTPTIGAIVNSTAINASSTASSTTVANTISFTSVYSGSNVQPTFFFNNSDLYYAALNNNPGGFTSNATFLFSAKYPGALGSSLAISMIDTAAAYSSNLTSVGSVVFNPTVGNTTFIPNSNVATFYFTESNAATTAAVTGAIIANVNFASATNMASYIAWNNLTVGDWVTLGNSSIGFQNLQITSKGTAPVFVANVGTLATSAVITGLTSTANIAVGMLVSAQTGSTGVLNANNLAQVVAVNSTAVTINVAATGAGTANLHFAQEFFAVNFSSPYTLSTAYSPTLNTYGQGNIGRLWQFYSSVTQQPNTSVYTATYGNVAAVDEVHAVVYDAGGKITNVPGTVLEVYQGLSRATDAKTIDGAALYYQTVLNQNSQYVWWTNFRGGGTYVNSAASIASLANNTPLTIQFAGGQDGFVETNVGTNLGVITAAYDQFKSVETAPISLLLGGKDFGVAAGDNTTGIIGNYLIQNIAQVRQDCVAFVSPPRYTVVNNVGNEYSSVTTFRNTLTSSSYGVLDSGYKYQYDKYNDVYRYIPLNGDIAGLCVYTDNTKDPWWSPAGFNRGQIKNLVKLAWNPKKAERDAIYPNGINPVVTFPGQGTVLFGDRTLQTKPSAFDRINVRRLFIVLEKAIAAAAQYTLFEFNDAFTRAQFVSLVTPFLKDVQGRRGITDFYVVCDTTNNTQQVIDANQFVGDIYIKPARSINYIQLNFVAVRTGVDFSTIVGKF